MAENNGLLETVEGSTDRPRTKSGKDRSRKSKEIATTPIRPSKGVGAVTPGEQPISRREQQSSKKKREEQKQTMEEYFGKGDRVQPPSKGGTPVQSILLKRLTKTKASSMEKEKSDDAQKGATAVEDHIEVDLEGFAPGVRPKGIRTKKRENKGKEATIEAQARKTKVRKPTIAFGPTEVAKEKPIV